MSIKTSDHKGIEPSRAFRTWFKRNKYLKENQTLLWEAWRAATVAERKKCIKKHEAIICEEAECNWCPGDLERLGEEEGPNNCPHWDAIMQIRYGD